MRIVLFFQVESFRNVFYGWIPVLTAPSANVTLFFTIRIVGSRPIVDLWIFA